MNKSIQTVLIGVLLLGTTACGKKSFNTAITTDGGNGSLITPPNPSPTPTPTPEASPTAPAYTFDFDMTGYNGVWTSPAITGADSILKVTIRPNPTLRVEGTGYDLNYGCAKFEVEFAGETRTSPLIRPQGSNVSMCPGQGPSAWTDFSSRLGGGGPVQIKVKHARTDFLCQNYYWWVPGSPETFACPVHAAYDTHHVTGTLCVQVNGTVSCPN